MLIKAFAYWGSIDFSGKKCYESPAQQGPPPARVPYISEERVISATTALRPDNDNITASHEIYFGTGKSRYSTFATD